MSNNRAGKRCRPTSGGLTALMHVITIDDEQTAIREIKKSTTLDAQDAEGRTALMPVTPVCGTSANAQF
jgi:hypothetical protein